jgi:tRNA dimethylallyltransferase
MPAPAPEKVLIVIVGPTAIGKTALSIKIAQHFDTEIISADSRQFFREMHIGTAKPSAEELAAVPHHFIDSHSVDTLFSTGDFEYEALQRIEGLFAKHNQLVMVGGSGLYIDAICKGLDVLPEIDLKIREELNQMLASEGIAYIQDRLREADPDYYNKVDQSNPQRMIRGLEVFLSTGIRLSSILTNSIKKRPFRILKIGLNTERPVLYDRINLRVDQMIEQGLVDEAKQLLSFRKYNALNTVGYSELFDYFDGKITLHQAIELIKQNTRRFAKRQLTWFRKDPEIIWFEPNQTANILQHLEEQLDQ